MTKNKPLIYITLAIIIVFLVFVFLRKEEHLIPNQTTSQIEVTENKVLPNKIAVPVNLIQVKVKVIDRNFNVNVADGATVEEAMTKLKNENKDFNFVGKNYGSMGIFVESLNGINGTSKKFWKYYVNDVEASVGVSKYILKDGDIISWQLENSY